ncbi:MAG: hypothetical protein HOY71_36985 [Nonomuraea sp.]|nr:hypothetical protein [Nonomuraea sp.]
MLVAGVPVVEGLAGLDELPLAGVRFTAAPPVGARAGGVRAFARAE